MPNSRRHGHSGELPGTLRRSCREAQEVFIRARDEAVRIYGEGDEACRVAYAVLKQTFEKRGDHWIPRSGSAA